MSQTSLSINKSPDPCRARRLYDGEAPRPRSSWATRASTPSTETLEGYREAELKHGRLAMLAAAGWPVSELVQPWLSSALGAPNLLAAGDEAPSLLNGGLDKISPLFFMAIIVFSATVEATALTMKRGSGGRNRGRPCRGRHVPASTP